VDGHNRLCEETVIPMKRIVSGPGSSRALPLIRAGEMCRRWENQA